MADVFEETCRRLVANDPTLTTLYMDFSWQPEEWKRVFYQDLPKNHTVQEMVITNMQGRFRLPEEERERLALLVNDAAPVITVDDHHLLPPVDVTVVADDDEGSSELYAPIMNMLKQFFDGVAHAMENHPKLYSLFMAGFDIVSSYESVVQAMKRKSKTMNLIKQESNPETPFLFACGLCACHIVDHGIIRDLLASNILKSYIFHDCHFATPPTLEHRFSLGLRELSTKTTTTTTPLLKTFMFQTEFGPPPFYLMNDIQVLLQNHPGLEELNIRCEGREEDWWTLAHAFCSESQKYPHHAIDTSKPPAKTNAIFSLQLQRLKIGLYGNISIDIIQAISFICCEKSTASCVKELDFSHAVFSYDALELLTLVLSRVPRAVVDSLNLTEVTLDDEDEDLRSSLYPTMGAMLVRKLIVQGIGLDSDNWSSFSRGLALNPIAEYLDVSSNTIGTEEVMALGRQFLAAHANHTTNNNNGSSSIGNQRGAGIGGLKELRLDDVPAGDEGAEFMAQVVLQEATSLQVLSIDNFGAAGLMAFARGIAHMPSLRKLTFGVFVTEYTNEFFTTLLQSLQVNRTLVELNLEALALDKNVMASTYLPKVKYWLSINKAGRSLLAHNEEDVSMGLWLSVLAKSSHDVDAMFFLVQENTRLWPYLVS